ncbi:hypothetical protein WJX72_007380 [[Myrmecia] bisecta]|uniref:Uncharacterized protein n=1 Tax=[Myrmecia] bisecta TaxID=41462 RepID=A0AAW1Q496_9CHLO
MEELLRRGQAEACQASATAVLVTAPMAEQMIERLTNFGVEEVGSSRWVEQHEWVEKLNLQAHHNAQTHSDEFVMEGLVSHDKLTVLVQELLVFEVWKDKVFPHLKQHIAEKLNSIAAYLLLYHEAAVANLLEVSLFHQQACESVAEEALVELCDWCYRKLVYLNTEAHNTAEPRERDVRALLNQPPEEELREKVADIEFGTAMCALTILRYLSDYVGSLPLGVMSRLVGANDTIMALLPLLDRPPWVRRRQKQTEKYIGNRWTVVEPAERLKLTQADAQVWLALHNLVVDAKCRAKYDFDEHRREALVRVKRYMNEVLFDQLPLLKDLQRVIDEISLGFAADAKDAQQSRLIIEQVPTLRDALLRRNDWQQIADRQRGSVFGRGAAQLLSKRRMDEMLKAFDFMCEMQPNEETRRDAEEASTSAVDQVVHFESWRRVKAGMHECWSEIDCQIDASKPSEPVELKAEDGLKLKATRYRLQAMDGPSQKPLPGKGKVTVRHGQHRAEALLELPSPETREATAQLPLVIWLTVGLLATDGFALQLKLKRAEKATHRDKLAGVWYVYHPVGGAITLLDRQQST